MSSQAPLEVRIDAPARLVHIRYLSDPTFQQWVEAMEAIFANPAFQSGFGFLSDRRPVDQAPSTLYVREVSQFIIDHADRLRGSRLAMVVGNTATYGTARMSHAMIQSTGLEQAVFTDPAEALRWLNEPRSG